MNMKTFLTCKRGCNSYINYFLTKFSMKFKFCGVATWFMPTILELCYIPYLWLLQLKLLLCLHVMKPPFSVTPSFVCVVWVVWIRDVSAAACINFSLFSIICPLASWATVHVSLSYNSVNRIINLYYRAQITTIDFL